MANDQNTEKLANLEKRIESGDFGRDFHLFVQNEIYPLIVDEEITLDQFTGLVQRYADQTHPNKIVNK